MKFQALVFDLDGTAIPKHPDGMPTHAVIDAVAAAKKVCHVSIATARSYPEAKNILDALDIEDLSILNGGSHLYSRKTNEFVWKQEIDMETLKLFIAQLRDEKLGEFVIGDEKHLQKVPLAEYDSEEPVALVAILYASKKDAQKIVSIARQYSALAVHTVASWKPDTLDVFISHELATKKHALQSLLARLNIDMDKTMVVGDGGNDLPLFELAGLKVAMGNAEDILKAHADWIAPSVDDDGLAVAIRKFIL